MCLKTYWQRVKTNSTRSIIGDQRQKSPSYFLIVSTSPDLIHTQGLRLYLCLLGFVYTYRQHHHFREQHFDLFLTRHCERQNGGGTHFAIFVIDTVLNSDGQGDGNGTCKQTFTPWWESRHKYVLSRSTCWRSGWISFQVYVHVKLLPDLTSSRESDRN